MAAAIDADSAGTLALLKLDTPSIPRQAMRGAILSRLARERR